MINLKSHPDLGFYNFIILFSFNQRLHVIEKELEGMDKPIPDLIDEIIDRMVNILHHAAKVVPKSKCTDI